MRLSDFLKYDTIVIQCHDDPDADAIASGYALYCYYHDKDKNVRLLYSGRNRISKSNLVLLLENYDIPIEYVAPDGELIFDGSGILITVDCQYGAGNVTRFDTPDVAIIDHHQIEIDNVEKSLIRSDLGSCSTLVWSMLKNEGFLITDDKGLGTCLYYGLYTDTNQFSELFNPLDRDLMDQVVHDNSKVTLLKNSNITLEDLEVAGVAMLRYSFNEDYGFAIVKSAPCDPNILGLISDFLLQVDRIKVCVVFNELADGYKLSIRSCVREVNASELAAYLSENIGSGGGHYEKAGAFVSRKLYRRYFDTLAFEGYLHKRLSEYHDSYEIIDASDYEVDLGLMQRYTKKPLTVGFVRMKDVLPNGTPITVRTMEGDSDLTVEDDLYIMIGVKGEVYPIREEKFLANNKELDIPYIYEEHVVDSKYKPTIKNRLDGGNLLLTDYAKACVPTGKVSIYARRLEKNVKVFTTWDREKYMLGKIGDYLAVREDDLHDLYVIESRVFGISYE